MRLCVYAVTYSPASRYILLEVPLASCLIYAWALPAHPYNIVGWVRSYTEPDLFDNNVPFDNTTPIYLINPLWKLASGLVLDLE